MPISGIAREPRRIARRLLWTALAATLLAGRAMAAGSLAATNAPVYPPPLDSYGDAHLGLWDKLVHRASVEPLNWVASVLFLLAILHTFLAPKFMHLAHRWRDQHRIQSRENGIEGVSFKAEIMHFLGEVEAVFGIWVVPLLLAFVWCTDWHTAKLYVDTTVRYTEPLFVVVVMTMAATRPVLGVAERLMTLVARLGGGGPAASWGAILTLGPLLGSVITEPAAMTIAALLLSRQFYAATPRPMFAYATLGLLFVNISIGGTLTHFAAPPVLMVAERWGWGTAYMATHFGWRALVAIVASNIVYYLAFRRQFAALAVEPAADRSERGVPAWVTTVHLLFLGWTVFTAHDSPLFLGGFLFFLAFTAATEQHQSPIALRPALLVGFFLAGLVIHGGLQSWWIAPVIQSMDAQALFYGAAVLTAFNDNAAITFLATLVPNLGTAMKYAVVAGAVTGGGLTVIANAPNPAGQAILGKHFPDGVAAGGLFLGALPATIIAALIYLLT